MEGWIKLHRQIRQHWVFKDADYFKAWITILTEVNHQSTKVLIEGELIECSRGQSINSLSTWVSILGDNWTIQKIRTFFKLLENDGMINTEGLRKTTRLTVCNYESYQSEQQADNKQTTSRQHTANTQLTTNKNEKNEKNDKEEKKIERSIELERQFEDFWNAYDKKVDAKKCKSKFMKLADYQRTMIMNTVKSYVLSTPDPKYRKNPYTWLNGEGWRDEIHKVEPVRHEPRKNFSYEDLMNAEDNLPW